MGYLLKATIGAALFIGCLVLFNVKLVSLLESGTCSSGNVPYDIAPGYQCPEHAGRDILLLTAGIFGMLIGAGIFAFRGESPRGRGRGGFGGMFGAGMFAWGLFFTATGSTALISSLTDEAIKNSNGGELAGVIVGITFLLMGLPALLISVFGLLKNVGRRDERPPMPADAGLGGTSSFGASRQPTSRLPWGTNAPRVTVGSGTGSEISKLERLQKLRESGALTDTEFEREKAKILDH